MRYHIIASRNNRMLLCQGLFWFSVSFTTLVVTFRIFDLLALRAWIHRRFSYFAYPNFTTDISDSPIANLLDIRLLYYDEPLFLLVFFAFFS